VEKMLSVSRTRKGRAFVNALKEVSTPTVVLRLVMVNVINFLYNSFCRQNNVNAPKQATTQTVVRRLASFIGIKFLLQFFLCKKVSKGRVFVNALKQSREFRTSMGTPH
jgi:hypothetical protein